MDLNIETWNVRSLWETAAIKSLTEILTKNKIRNLALQETRWKGNNLTKIGDYYFFCSSGEKHNLGVGFAVHKELRNDIMEFRPVSDRICLIRVRTKFFNLSLINAYAETEDKEDFTKDSFYNALERIYDTTPSNDIKIVLGDLNAKIGREPIYRPVIGKESLHSESNNNGKRVIDFTVSKNMVIVSTCFLRKDIRKYIWKSPDGITHN